MANSAEEALKRAAARAQRHVEVENAKLVIERTLGYELDVAHGFEWVSLLFHAFNPETSISSVC